MYLERKWGTEMSNESQLYSFIEKYLIDKRIEIIQNEVKLYFILNLCAKFSLKSQPSIYGKYGKWIL